MTSCRIYSGKCKFSADFVNNQTPSICFWSSKMYSFLFDDTTAQFDTSQATAFLPVIFGVFTSTQFITLL